MSSHLSHQACPTRLGLDGAEVMTFPAQRGGHPDDLMTVSDVASLLRVSTTTVYRLMRAGELTSVRVGRSFHLRRADVAEYLRGSRLGWPEELPLPLPPPLPPHGPHGARGVHTARLATTVAGAPEDAADDLLARAPHDADLRPAQRLDPGADELTGNRLDTHHPARQARMFLNLARAALAVGREELAGELLESIHDIAGELPAELVVQHLELVAALRAESALEPDSQ